MFENGSKNKTLTWIRFVRDIRVEDPVGILDILRSNDQVDALTQRQTEVVLIYPLISSDHAVYSSRVQDAFCEIRIETALEGPDDDEFRVRSETTRVKGCVRLWFGRGFLNRQVIDEIDMAIGAPQETGAVLRFALGAEHS